MVRARRIWRVRRPAGTPTNEDFAERFAEASRRLAARRAEGRPRGDVHVINGLEAFARALGGLFEGVNLGKLVLKIAPRSKEFM